MRCVCRNFLVPIPPYGNFDELNTHLEEKCLERVERRHRGHKETIGEWMKRDREAVLPLPAVPYDPSDKHTTWVSSPSLVRRYVDEVVITCGSEVIARHRRS